MWLPGLTDALLSGRIDVAISCGMITASEGTASEVFCAEPLLVGLADTDLAATRWANQPGVDWILLIPSRAAAHDQTVVLPVAPRLALPT
jgi:hypothetical protein